MRQLIEAIVKRFEASTFATTQNGIWPWQAGQGVKLPYVTFEIGTVPVDYVMGIATPREETYPVMFRCWLGLDTYDSKQALDTILTAYEALIALFDEAPLPMADWHVIRCARTSFTPNPDFADLGWSIAVSYEISIEED